ncbi:glycosyltransferase [Candidatus Kaiserbacteria bacterium]|nr:glycosyltransferase [Candidatus Kaiserbacteria bacterium]
MRIFYIANIRIPTEKAHGVAIVKSCEAYAKEGAEVTLVAPKRRTPFEKSIFETYGVAKNFAVRFLPVIDTIGEKAGPLVFWLETFTFYVSLIVNLLFENRKTIIYTREPGFILLRLMGFKVAFECHLIPKQRGFFFFLCHRASSIVVISQALKQSFVKAGFKPESILVAPSGVDLSIFDIEISRDQARLMLDLPKDKRLAVYTGNFTTMGEDKGISDILRALPDALDVVFVAAGGSEKDRLRYVAQASELGVLGRVILRGSTTQKILAMYQKAADVLLMPFPDTPHYRNHMSPVKMFEYMAAKRPIIASDLPTIREVLNDTNAVIIPSGDLRQLAQALEKTGLDSLAARAYEDVARYSWTARTKRVIEHIGL